MSMERIQKICHHPLWCRYIEAIRVLEQDRIFCRHDPAHFLDVARLAQLENLEQHRQIEKEWIYAAALLHDIGRHLEYTEGIPHDQASAALAPDILQDCGFSSVESQRIVEAIRLHRTPETAVRSDLAGLIYRADKKSRMCLFCSAEPQCDWSHEKKNWTVME